ncbi:MAG TPA: N-acetyltransferase [Ruminiclostridium sp.]|jgi:ribosomal protein S18 acetylase RimI-like enzyme|uniref:GNAT family N-acetyltransferase n=1 Tax=Acetivibrio saccincola TaxID=1677857 RepID=A0A2S8R8K1_9FIRM|nr:GNAT family N-acetyltransferase [Acetivibrio saccincola]NLW26888.1 GNAT family N-acetyltransferase [Acetivibrio saccincola]PQQ66130.1 GNAT family N-acetyltransferase [Acetivibrio saccincola]HAA43393.1 N-acetyltransferase [Ruminiclostridium sp.]HQD29070.1 GNAT family N-acetyltransferase [Acetivibrio saccincola]
MNYSFIIRKAVESDAEAIHNILNEAFKDYISRAGISGTVKSLNETIEDIKNDIRTKEVFIGLIDNVPTGTIRIAIQEDNTAYINRFGVLPEYHNIGVGKALIKLVDKYLISNQIKKVYLHTASTYKDLIIFYYNLGFHIESTSKEDGYVRALLVKHF